MIIAIDEVGDFAPTSKRYNFMVAALLTRHNNGLLAKQRQFDHWKNSIGKEKFTNQNEVKGSDLSDEELFRFTNEVVISEPFVRNIQIRIIPAETSKSTFDTYKKVESDLIKLMIAHSERISDKDGIEFYRRFSNWFRDRNFQHYMKMVLLENCIGRSVEMSVGVSIIHWLLKDDTDLMNLEIKIDKDFINKQGEKKYFKELLKQSFRKITEEHPIPMVRELLESDHAFVRANMLPNGMINLASVFNNRCDFFDSHLNFELQIADILGTILHRSQNKNTCMDSAQLIDQVLGNRGQTKVHLVLNQNADTKVEIRFENPNEI